MRIGLLGAGRIAKMHAQAPSGAGARDELLSAAPGAIVADANESLIRAGMQRGSPVLCDTPLLPGHRASLARLDDPYRSILRLDETPCMTKEVEPPKNVP